MSKDNVIGIKSTVENEVKNALTLVVKLPY